MEYVKIRSRGVKFLLTPFGPGPSPLLPHNSSNSVRRRGQSGVVARHHHITTRSLPLLLHPRAPCCTSSRHRSEALLPNLPAAPLHLGNDHLLLFCDLCCCCASPCTHAVPPLHHQHDDDDASCLFYFVLLLPFSL